MKNNNKNVRCHRFPIMLSKDENEYLARKSYSHGTSSGYYARLSIFNVGWRNELEILREVQPKNLKDIDSRRK